MRSVTNLKKHLTQAHTSKVLAISHTVAGQGAAPRVSIEIMQLKKRFFFQFSQFMACRAQINARNYPFGAVGEC
jgi:hypothetical protein